MSGGESRRSGYRSALRSRDYRWLMGTELVSATGAWAYNVALVVFVFERTHSAAWVSAAALCRFLPALVFSAYGGVIAERFERVRLMIVLNALGIVLQLGLAAVAWQKGAPVLALSLAALTALVRTPYRSAVAALVPQVVDESDLAAANALNATIDNVVIVLGPAVGAGLLLLGGPALAIAMDAVAFLLAGLGLTRMSARSEPSDVTDGGRRGPLRQVTDGFKALVSSASVATFVAFSVLASFVYGTDTVLFVPIARVQLHAGTSGYGYLLAGLGVGGVAGAAVVNKLAARTRLAGAILGGMAVYCLPTAFLVVVHQPVVGVVLQAVRGAGTLVVDTLAITALQRSAPKEMVARVFGAFFALVLGAISLGAFVTPILLRAGLHPAMLVYGLGIPALCLLALPRLLKADRLASVQAAAMAPRVAILERLDLFASASQSSLERLASSATETFVSPGTVVVAEGADADAFYVIEGGDLAVSAVGEGSEPVALRTLGAGTYFGEIGLLGHMPRTATVTATSECRLLRIGGDDFLDALSSLSASPALLEGARTRLALTHPSRSLEHAEAVDVGTGDDGATTESVSD